MNGLQKNAKNLHFWAFRAKWSILDSFWPKWAKRKFFSKKALGAFLSGLEDLTNCKVSEKSNERFSSNRLTDAWTDERT